MASKDSYVLLMSGAFMATENVRVRRVTGNERVQITLGGFDITLGMDMLRELTNQAADVLDVWFTEKEAAL